LTTNLVEVGGQLGFNFVRMINSLSSGSLLDTGWPKLNLVSFENWQGCWRMGGNWGRAVML